MMVKHNKNDLLSGQAGLIDEHAGFDAIFIACNNLWLVPSEN